MYGQFLSQRRLSLLRIGYMPRVCLPDRKIIPFSNMITLYANTFSIAPLLHLPRFRDMLPLNCQNNASNVITGSVTNGESIQSLQSIDSNGTNLAMSPLSTMSMSPVAVNPCSPMGMSPMASRHPRYATPVAPSSVHTTHPHSGSLSPMNDVKALCYGRGVCETGKSFYLSHSYLFISPSDPLHFNLISFQVKTRIKLPSIIPLIRACIISITNKRIIR